MKELCSRYETHYPVNVNCHGQITVSGLAEHMVAFSADVKAAGGRVLPLKVKGAFHSPFMEQAAQKFAKELEKEEIMEGAILRCTSGRRRLAPSARELSRRKAP